MNPLIPRKVLFAVTKSNLGGAQGYVATLAKAAQDAGMDVAVAAGRAGDANGMLFKELADMRVHTLPLTHITRNIGLLSEWRTLQELVRLLASEQPAVLHLNSSKMGLLGAIAGRYVGINRIVFTAHGWPYKEARSFLWKLVAWIGSWLTVQLAHVTIVVSQQDHVRAPVLFFRDRIHLVHNGMGEFPLLSRTEARSALSSGNPEMLAASHWLLMNAELHPNKGVDVAIRALAELRPQHKDIALVVCGTGDAAELVARLAQHLHIEKQVFFLGYVPHARQYLAAADIYLMPSHKEGLPLALLEAGIAALPVVASRVGGIPEVVIDEESGLLVPRADTHALAGAIHRLLQNPEEGSRMGAALRDRIQQVFSEDQMVSATFALY